MIEDFLLILSIFFFMLGYHNVDLSFNGILVSNKIKDTTLLGLNVPLEEGYRIGMLFCWLGFFLSLALVIKLKFSKYKKKL